MQRELYVYYRVVPDRTEAARAAVQRLFDQLRREQPELTMRLLRRPPEAGQAAPTWMEVYALPGAGIDDALQERIGVLAARALRHLLEGERHTEVFTPL